MITRLGFILLLTLLLALMGCGDDEHTELRIVQPNTSEPYLSARITDPNVLPVTIGGLGLCGTEGYINEPCTSVTLCVPGTDDCQVIGDVLVDTGSYGLRIFESVVELPLRQLIDEASGNGLAQCAQFGTGSSWGPVVSADVMLGGQPPVSTSIQLMNKDYARLPDECIDADETPQETGFNGILGIGVFAEDCGIGCERRTSNRLYFSCPDDGECESTRVPVARQLQNPVALLPDHNNGVLVALPPVEPGGVEGLNGLLILGIGTAPNNLPQGVVAYGADRSGNIVTRFNGKDYPDSFVDTGSNGLYFPQPPELPTCSDRSGLPHFYCPSALTALQATASSASGQIQGLITFGIGNAQALFTGDAIAFSELGGPARAFFDWGLPFYFGRAVFHGIEGKPTPLGTGPYFAF